MSSQFAPKVETMRVLISAGFTMLKSESKPSYFVALVERTELLGVRVRYAIALTNGRLNSPAAETLGKWAEQEGAPLAIVGDSELVPAGASLLSMDQLFDRLGGSVFSMLPLEQEYSSRLISLGNNETPGDLVGNADDLFEQYVYAGLQFIFRSRVVRYGKDRSGEAVADGLALSSSMPLLLYDAKAAKDGYEMSKDEERKFEDYVREFHARYERVVGRLSAIVVISGSFADSSEALTRRHRQVLAGCGVPLAFMDAKTMVRIVSLMVSEPMFRTSIDWRLVFSEPIVRSAVVESELSARKRDRLLRGH